MQPDIKQHLWYICAGTFLSVFPSQMTKEEMEEIMEAGDAHPRANELEVWDPFQGETLRSILRNIQCLFNSLSTSVLFSVVSKKFVASADELARYVNFNGEEDESYEEWLQAGNEPDGHIAYHAAVVGGWDDTVYARFADEIGK